MDCYSNTSYLPAMTNKKYILLIIYIYLSLRGELVRCGNLFFMDCHANTSYLPAMTNKKTYLINNVEYFTQAKIVLQKISFLIS